MPVHCQLGQHRESMRAQLTALAARIGVRRAMTTESVLRAQHCLRTADAVCFDFDSTLIEEEGIDVLAEHCGAGAAVAEWTRKAMGGDVKFEDALAARLALIEPSRSDVDACLARRPPKVSEGAAEFVAALAKRNVTVYVVSGGLRCMIEPTAAALGVPPERVFANTVEFDAAGGYAGFDAAEPTARDGGKPAVVATLKAAGARTVVMVGDGATDAQAKPPADAFVGYGGVVERAVVKDAADWFVTSFAELRACLGERPRAAERALAGAPVQPTRAAKNF